MAEFLLWSDFEATQNTPYRERITTVGKASSRKALIQRTFPGAIPVILRTQNSISDNETFTTTDSTNILMYRWTAILKVFSLILSALANITLKLHRRTSDTVNSLMSTAYWLDVFGKSSFSHILPAILLKHVSHRVELSLLPLVQVLKWIRKWWRRSNRLKLSITYDCRSPSKSIEWRPTRPIVWLTNRNSAAASDRRIETIGALIAGAHSPPPSLSLSRFP